VQRLFSPTPTRSTDSDSPILPSLPLPPVGWSLSSTFANIDLDPPLWSTNNSSSSQHQPCVNFNFELNEKFVFFFLELLSLWK
jgi:hypothetical protein